jgi:hypothetical protein
MKKITFCIALILISICAFSQNEIITKKGEHISFSSEPEVNDIHSYKWRTIEIDGIKYAVAKLKSIQIGNDFYTTVDQRRMWKRVVHGSINVFALKETDTIHSKNRVLKQNLYIQNGDFGKIISFNNRNLYHMVESDSILEELMYNKLSSSRNGKAIMIPGIVTMGISGAALLISGFLALFGDDEIAPTLAPISAVGLSVGTGAMISGLILNKKGKQLSLDPIYEINSQK